LSEACAERLVDVEIVNEREPSGYDLLIVGLLEAARRLDFFRSKEHDWLFVSARGKQWLEDHAPEWLRFEPVFSADTCDTSRLIPRKPQAVDVDALLRQLLGPLPEQE